MGSIVVLSFSNEAAADGLQKKLEELQDRGALQIDDAVKVTVDENGKTKVHHGFSVARGGALLGGTFGAVVGMLFLAPVAGAAIGAAGGAAIGKLSGDYGIDEDFIKQTSAALKPGTAALFLMVSHGTPEKIEAEIRGTEAVVISTTLSEESEARLKAALSATRADD